jgi:hypothetical protein
MKSWSFLLSVLGLTALSVPESSAFEQTTDMQDLEVEKCAKAPLPFISQDAINFSYSALTTLKTLSKNPQYIFCNESQVRLFCRAGSCGVFFNSGRHGYNPLECSRARIGSRVWDWCGDQPNNTARNMWEHLSDGVEVATQIARWPSGRTNFREIPLKVKAAKIATYNASLGL